MQYGTNGYISFNKTTISDFFFQKGLGSDWVDLKLLAHTVNKRTNTSAKKTTVTSLLINK